MHPSKKQKRKAIVPTDHCVACGCCVPVCPRRAINIYKGIYAVVTPDLCIGCSKCERVCPASVIQMVEVTG
jgi:ferredoxin